MKISSQAFSIGILFFSFIFMQVACSNSPEPEPVDDRLTIRLTPGETLPKSNTSTDGNTISTFESFSYDIDTDILTLKCSGSEGGTSVLNGFRIMRAGLGVSIPIGTGTLAGLVVDGLRETATFTGFLRENGMDNAEYKQAGEYEFECLTISTIPIRTTITYEVIPIKDL